VAELAAELQRLSSTTLTAQGAANAWAGTAGLSLQGALNAKAGTSGRAIQGVLNTLAGTTGLGVSAAAAAITSGAAVIVSDAFTRSDLGNGELGNPDVGPSWGTIFRTWGINSNQAACTSASGQALVGVIPGVQNYKVQATVAVTDSGTALVFRLSTASTYYMLVSGGGLYALYRNVSNSATLLGQAAGGNSVNGDVIAADIRGGVITCYRNGTQLLQVTDGTPLTGVYCGLRADTTAARFDNFTVTA
jgi:hypothetical protein